MNPDTARLLLCLASMLTLPGWALLGTHSARFAPLQRWCLSLCLSVACYPVAFYAARMLAPDFRLDPALVTAVLFTCGCVALWRLRGRWREQFAFDGLELVAIGVFALTVLTRWWILRSHPFPAWSDSLHHTLLTRLTAQQGRLPATLEPYFPVPLVGYHLGLYALTGCLEMLSGAESHRALVFLSQVLNGLCGLGVYLFLDRRVGRSGAIAGAVVVGLIGHQPAWYVNWGRFTQLAAQTLLLPAGLLSWEALRAWNTPEHDADRTWLTFTAVLMNAAVFFLHFRVAIFLAPLLAFAYLSVSRQPADRSRLRTGSAALIAFTMMMVLPQLLPAALDHLARASSPPATPPAPQSEKAYFEFGAETVEPLVASRWLLGVAGVAVVRGLSRRDEITGMMAAWVATLLMLGTAWRLHVPWLRLTNMGAVLIALYLPIGVLVGVGVESLVGSAAIRRGVLGVTLVAALAGAFARTRDVEPFRHFVTPADVEAMNWIRTNTPAGARFAVNTHFWLTNTPHGTDAGYWIPYFTGRRTTVGCMLLNLGSREYQRVVIEESRSVDRMRREPERAARLLPDGVDYVYLGARGSFDPPALDAEALRRGPGLRLAYARDGVYILQRIAPGGSAR